MERNMFLMIPDNYVLPLRVSLARIMTRDTELLIISFQKEEGFQLHLKCNRVSLPYLDRELLPQ